MKFTRRELLKGAAALGAAALGAVEAPELEHPMTMTMTPSRPARPLTWRRSELTSI
jgi:hypothetical protein